jgi:acyl carrier protein
MTPLTADDVKRFLLDHFAPTIAANGLDATQLGDDFDLFEAGVVDSLGVIEMISAVEKRFNITIDFETMDPAELTVLGPFSRFVAENAVSKTPVP